MKPRRFHVVGAGVSGLAAAVRLAANGNEVCVHEAAGFAGGRCRSHSDDTIGTIDNGNHLLLSGNHAALAFLDMVGAGDSLLRQERAVFPFVDLQSGERWQLDLGGGVLPLWLLFSGRRVPDTDVFDYLSLARLIWCRRDMPVAAVVSCSGKVYDRLLRPLLTAALNVEPGEASALLVSRLLLESVAAGGRACRPLIVRDGLTATFVDPALNFLRRHGAAIRFHDPLRGLKFGEGRTRSLTFAHETVELSGGEAVILAVRPDSAVSLLPGIVAPDDFRPILNFHFRHDSDGTLPAMTGVTGGLSEWVFVYPNRISVTISNAVRLASEPREPLAKIVWNEIRTALGIPKEIPPFKAICERRATFAATPEQRARRPRAETQWRNLFLAGDWTDTGIPATIEGAVRSGNRAADLALAA